MSLGTVLLIKIFPALLPPENPQDRDFYSVLDLKSRNASEQEIRKQYKKKSLSLHPDKIAQRRENAITAEEAAEEYQLVQEAHSCLSDKASRQTYHATNCSPTRYRFLTQGGGMGNHMGILENLSKASFGDKTRLVLFVSTVPALLLVQPILVAVKVNDILKQEGGLQDASWVALLIPWWIFHGLFLIFWITVTFMAPPGSKLSIASTAVEHFFWLLAELLLAIRWDETITADYSVVFIPAYLAIVMRWLHYVILLKSITSDMSKMVSKNYFVDIILHGREPEELEEEELKDLHEKYVVVSQIPLEVEASLGRNDNGQEHRLSDEEKEDIRVASSREFEMALRAYSSTRKSMVKSIILDVIFVVLLVLKVDGHKDFSWWLVFLPVWVSNGWQLFRNCFICCCSVGPMSADEAFILSKAKETLDESKKNGDYSGANNGNEEREETTDDENGEPNEDTPAKGSASEPSKGKGASTGETETDPQASLDEDAVRLAEKSALDISPKESTKKEERETDANDGNDADVDPKPNGDESKDPDDNFSAHMDEEAYRAYRSAYAEAEADAMEKRVRAGQTTCLSCVQLIVVLLLVAKLEQSYEAVEEREEGRTHVDVGFNALWLLFPLFLIVGFMISCCACLIYGAPSPEDLMQHEDGDGDREGPGDGDEEANNARSTEAATSNSAADEATPLVLAASSPAEPAKNSKQGPTEPEEKENEKQDMGSFLSEGAQDTPPEKARNDINDLD